jgi:hypothetical protein
LTVSRSLALAFAVAGCLPPKVSYVDFPLPPEQAKPQLERDARAAGIDVAAPTCLVVVCDPATWQLRMGTRWSLLYLAPHGAGSRVQILDYDYETARDRKPVLLPPSLAAQPVHELKPDPEEDGWSDRFVEDFEVSAGVERDPRVGLDWRMIIAGQVGARLARWGELGDTPHHGYSMALMAGGGISLTGTGPALMPELTLSFDRQPLVEPFAGMRVPEGRRYALDFTVAGVFLDDEHEVEPGAGYTYRNGLELAVTLREPGLGGITARVGHLWGPDGGTTALVALRPFKPMHAVYAAIAIALGGIVYLAATHPPSLGPPSGG